MSIADLPDSGKRHLPLKLTWQSIDPSANRYRTFVLRVDEDLWGNPCVVRRPALGQDRKGRLTDQPHCRPPLDTPRHICCSCGVHMDKQTQRARPQDG